MTEARRRSACTFTAVGARAATRTGRFVVDRTIGLVLPVAQARFAAAELALLNLGGGHGEARALLCHVRSVVIARAKRNGGLVFAHWARSATMRGVITLRGINRR